LSARSMLNPMASSLPPSAQRTVLNKKSARITHKTAQSHKTCMPWKYSDWAGFMCVLRRCRAHTFSRANDSVSLPPAIQPIDLRQHVGDRAGGIDDDVGKLPALGCARLAADTVCGLPFGHATRRDHAPDAHLFRRLHRDDVIELERNRPDHLCEQRHVMDDDLRAGIPSLQPCGFGIYQRMLDVVQPFACAGSGATPD